MQFVVSHFSDCSKEVNEILTGSSLLKRQKKEIEELRSKLMASNSEDVEVNILDLRNTLLKSELERERIALELEEEKKVGAERENALRMINGLTSRIFVSSRDETGPLQPFPKLLGTDEKDGYGIGGTLEASSLPDRCASVESHDAREELRVAREQLAIKDAEIYAAREEARVAHEQLAIKDAEIYAAREEARVAREQLEAKERDRLSIAAELLTSEKNAMEEKQRSMEKSLEIDRLNRELQSLEEQGVRERFKRARKLEAQAKEVKELTDMIKEKFLD